jgi:alanine racemase
MSHFANADAPEHAINRQQIERFQGLAASLAGGSRLGTSLCNSAGLTAFAEAQGDWVRPGIMLYGSSPLLQTSAAELDLHPVMQLNSRLIAINSRRRGDFVGYGSLWQCPEDMPVGVVAIGYGDGYPRHAQQGTPVWIGGQRTRLLGRVSMDMLTIDLRGIEQARCGDEVVLWGAELSVDEVAQHADTIAYQLLCNMGGCRSQD